MTEIANRMHLAVPTPRDDIERPPQIPETVAQGSKSVFDERQRCAELWKLADSFLSEWEEQQELYYEMDPDFQGIKHQKRYLLENDEWKFDKIPEIMDGMCFGRPCDLHLKGKNIMDFYDPQLLIKLEQIEREELIRLRKLEEEITERNAINAQYELTDEQKDKVRRIRERRGELIAENMKKRSIEGANVPRTAEFYHSMYFHKHVVTPFQRKPIPNSKNTCKVLVSMVLLLLTLFALAPSLSPEPEV